MEAKVIHEQNGHTVKAVKIEALANGILVVCLHCCDNPDTEHRMSIYRLHEKTIGDIEAAMLENAKFVAAQHASLEAARAHIKSLIGDEPAAQQKESMSILS
jgi:hypothetical protein